MVDYSGGFVAAITLLAGIHAARRDGKGMDCDLSLFDVAISLLSYLGTWRMNGDFTPTRTANSAHPSLVPFQNFEAEDGWVVVGCAKEKFWRRLTDVLGVPELAGDARFKDFAARRENAEVLLPILQEKFKTRSSHFWIERLNEAGVPCGPIQTVQEALGDPQTTSRGLVIEVDHPRFGRVRELASPVRVGTGREEHHRAPTRNENAPEVLTKMLGYSQKKIEELGSQGAFGSSSTVDHA